VPVAFGLHLHRRIRGCRIPWPPSAVTSGIGLKNLCDRFRAENDDYNANHGGGHRRSPAEAFAECLHKRVRDEWGYGRAEGLSIDDIIHEK